MAVDTSIYSNIRPFTMADPMDTAMKGMALGEAQRKFTLEDDISKALSESGGDYSKASQALAAKGRGTAAMSLSDKSEAQKKGQLEQHLKKMEAMASDGIALDAAYRQALQANGGDPQKAIAAIAPAYNDVRSRWAPQGVNLPETFDPVKNLAGVGQAKEVASYLKTLTPQKSELGKLVGERDALPAGDQRRTAYEEAIKKHSAATPTELARLTAERDALPQGDAKRADYDRVIDSTRPAAAPRSTSRPRRSTASTSGPRLQRRTSTHARRPSRRRRSPTGRTTSSRSSPPGR
jgi:hypothetical protein